MSRISRYLEQIALSSESIATLPFPPPKIFTNALLSTSDITSLIRDTEPHERALFSVPPPTAPTTASTPYPEPGNTGKRRQTVFNVASGEVTTGVGARGTRRNTAVAAVLGRDLHDEVRRTEGKGEIDIEVLLKGVEVLNGVYEIPGVSEKVQKLRTRHAQIQSSVRHYESKVARQTRDLERMNRGDWNEEDDGEDEEDDGEYEGQNGDEASEVEITDEDLRREEDEIRELERKKRELEDRVSGMERDLGGLLR